MAYQPRRRRRSHYRVRVRFIVLIVALVLAFAAVAWGASTSWQFSLPGASPTPSGTITPTPTGSIPSETPSGSEGPSGTPDTSPEPSQSPEPAAFAPRAVDSTQPSKFGMTSSLNVDGQNVSEYSRTSRIFFPTTSRYTQLEGIVSFRGNNFREGPFYGVAQIAQKKFAAEPWSIDVGGTIRGTDPSRVWDGCGWTGQPLIVKWPAATRQAMNLYPDKKNKDGLVEAIYATMDGKIYGIDIEDGSYTRDPIVVGFAFKGAGSLDPRGIPLMYVGAGDSKPNEPARAFIISLVEGKVLYEFGKGQDSFASRSFHAYDSSALVDAATDTLIYPGENGILYTMKLNTQYDEAAGTLRIDPKEMVKWKYKGERTDKDGKYWAGIEDSAVLLGEYIIFADNGGHLLCVNINTYEIVWVQDVLDDTNCTPVLEIEDGHPYVYISTSFHGGWRAPMTGTAEIPIWKIDAVTGEIIWATKYVCSTSDGVSGGVQATLAIGKGSLSDLIFVPVAKCPGDSGKLVALSKSDGKPKWTMEMNNYAWSSPVAVYDQDGKGYIVQCDSAGRVFLIDGLTGTVLDQITVGMNIEASPAVFNNTVVVGTRGGKIYGFKLQ